MKKLVTILILLAVVGGGAYYYYSYGQVEEKPQVVQATVSEGTITEEVQATGTLEPIRVVPVGSQVSGIVKNVYADFNSIVKQGQLIAEIDPDLLQVQVNLQEANVARQQGEIANQQVQLEDAQKQLERAQQLFDRQLTTQQALDQAILTVKQRETGLDAAKKQLITANANLDQAKLNVSYTKIYAPVDGVVVSKSVDPGQAVQASMTTPQFFTIATDLRQLKLTAGVDEADIGRIRRGMQVTFQVDTYPQATFSGVVEQVRLNATTQSNVVTYPVEIRVPNPDLRLFPSMTASLRIIVRSVENVVRIPNQATRFRPTNEMFTALGLEPPPQGNNRLVAGGGVPGAGAAAGGARGGDELAAAAAAAGRQGGATQAARGGAQGGQNAGRGGFDPNSMTPEQRQQMAAQFAGRAGGRGGRGRNGGQAANTTTQPVSLDAEKIDDVRTPVELRVQNVQVWRYDETTNDLTSTRIQIGISDGQFSQLVGGDLKVGDQVVTNIVLPVNAQQRQENLFQGGGRGGFGGRRGGF